MDSMHNRRVVYPGERGRGTVVIEPRENQKGRDEYMRLTGRDGVVRLSRRKGGKRPEWRKRGKEDTGKQKYPKQSIMN